MILSDDSCEGLPCHGMGACSYPSGKARNLYVMSIGTGKKFA